MDMPVNEDALASRVRDLVINRKANACPMVLRLAWHASGTYNKADGSGGRSGIGEKKFKWREENGSRERLTDLNVAQQWSYNAL